MKKIACVMLAAVFLSCTGNHREDLDLRTVKVDFSELEHISQSDGRIVHLEPTDSSLLYDICRLDVHEDTFVVQSRSFLSSHLLKFCYCLIVNKLMHHLL